MSLESAIERLTIATENNAAGREIIRQRDEAIKSRDYHESDARWEKSYRKGIQEELAVAQGRVKALRGVITRMKNQRKIAALDAPSVSR